MAETFSKQILKVVVAQLCQAIGWHGIASSALDLMTDVLHRYIESMGRQIHAYSEQFGRTEPNLIDVSLTYLDMGINLHELEEYIKNVDSIPCVYEVPKYPIPRESHLNFLKPGSREVVTRPVHVHEHLPPMHPEMEDEDYVGKQAPLSVDTTTTPGSTSPLTSPKANVFKRPGDPISMENPAMKRARLLLEEEGRPLREISSVMMTTSGFLSPAREGKLPESRTPLQPSDSRSNSPQPSSYPMVPPEVKGEKKLKKIPFKKMIDGTLKKIDKENKKKELKNKDLLKTEKVASSDESKKLHKKEKKDKDKLKKKNRKDKLKAKEKLEKKRIKIEKKVRLKEKLREKKEKKEKKKEKEKEKELREEKMDVSVPKITLRLGPASPRPPTPDAQPRKIWNDRAIGQRHGESWDNGSEPLPPAPSSSVIKPIVKKPEEVAEKSHPTPSSDRPSKREPSPELARISALIKGPPKPKSSSKTSLPKEAHRPEVALPLFSQPAVLASSTSAVTNASSSSVPSVPPALPSASPVTNNPILPPSSSSSSSLEKAAASKLKKALNTVAKIKPKHNPLAKKEFEAAAAAEPEAEPAEKQVAFYYDHEGNKVWICPACGGQDDGSPMIGCDDCDAWYHWVCVGIQVPPDENEDWYCRVCIVKKQENSVDKKKKPRKRKMLT